MTEQGKPGDYEDGGDPFDSVELGDEQSLAEVVRQRAADLLGQAAYKPLKNMFVKQCLDANERGDGVMAATLLRDGFRYNVTPREKDREWMVWTGHIWALDNTRRSLAAIEKCALEYQRAADELAKEIDEQGIDIKSPVAWKINLKEKYYKRVSRLRTIGGAGKALTYAPIVDPSMTCQEHDFDKQTWLLPVKNGVIDLRTGALTRGVPDDMLTRALDIEYDAHADYTPIATFLDEVSGDPEVSAFIKRYLGYAITGHSYEQFICLFIGPGRNGKGILFSMLADVMGPYYHTISRGMIIEQRNEPSPSSTSEHKYSLLGKRIIVGAETNKGQKIDAAAVKDLTGDDIINCRPNFKSELNFLPSHTLFLHTNHIPIGLTKEFSLKQRLLVIEFPYMYVDDVATEAKKSPRQADKFRKKDPYLKEKLKASRQGMLRFLVEGCREWQEHGLSPPQSVIDRVNDLSDEEDYISQFVEDCLVYEEAIPHKPQQRMKCTAMYDAFKWWWSVNMDTKARPSMKSINTALRERGQTVEKSGGKTWLYNNTLNFEIVGDIEDFLKKGEDK